MKVKIELQPNETVEQADDRLEKALHKKKECSGHEKYEDEAYNEFYDMVCKVHLNLLERIKQEVTVELERNASLPGHHR